MTYYDKIIVFKDIFPPMPQKVLEFFRETDDGFQALFFFLFTYVHSEGDIWQAIDDALSEVDWANHGLGDDGYSYQNALTDAVAAFNAFFSAADRQIGFLRRLPEGIVISDITVIDYDPNSLLLNVQYEEVSTCHALTVTNPGVPNGNTPKSIYSPPHKGII